MSGEIKERQVVFGEASAPAPIDNSLKKKGFAADAAETGRRFEEVNKRLDELNPVTAGGLSYDNSTSGLEATNVQSAVDEITDKVEKAVSSVDTGLEDALSKIDTKMEGYVKVVDKPSGSYVGNGSSAERKIDIKGKGNILIIYTKSSSFSSTVFLFVTPVGAVGHAGSSAVSIGGAHFEDGVLTISSSSEYINKKDVEYYYQVL